LENIRGEEVSAKVVCFLLLVLLCNGLGCNMKCSDKSDPETGANSFVLSASEIAANKAQSDAGDKDAAFSLYRHYMFGMCNEGEGRFWLKRAVALGHEQAKQHYSVLDDN
jgi:hypothetical protein